MSVVVDLGDDKVKIVHLDIWNQEEFLNAVQQTGLKEYQASVEKYRKELPKLSTKELKQRFIQFGEKAKKMHEEIFESSYSPETEHSPPSLIRGMHNYSYGPDIADQETIDAYAKKYREWMLVASEVVVLEELLEKRKGEDVIKKDAELSKADNRGTTFRRELDETILYFGSG
jgi:hypothetical protein